MYVDGRMSETHGQFEDCGEWKHPFYLLRKKPQFFSCPVNSSVTILTELSRIILK
jgi:hypothetical protein